MSRAAWQFAIFAGVLFAANDVLASGLAIGSALVMPMKPAFSNGVAQVAFSATASGGNPGDDYTLFYSNRTATIEMVRSAIMLPASPGGVKAGFDGTYIDAGGSVHSQGSDNLIQYDHFCCAFNNGCTLMDPNLTIGTALDYLNALEGIQTGVGATARSLMDSTSFVAGTGTTLTGCANGNCIPSGVTYPHAYQRNDRRETLFGHLYGAVPDAIHGSGGYIFVPGRNNLDAGSALPAIEAELVANNKSDYTKTDFSKTNSLPAVNLLCPWILFKYVRGTPDATNVSNAIVSLFNDWNPMLINSGAGGFQNYDPVGTASFYGFILHMMRATGSWNWNLNTVRGQSYRTVATQVAAALDGLVQTDGSIEYSYGTDKVRGPEQIGMYLCSADPRLPNFFNATNENYSWNWDFGDGSPHSTSQTPAHNYNGSLTTNYTISVIVTDQNGESASNRFTVLVSGAIPTSPPTLAWNVNGTKLTLSWPVSYTGWTLESQTTAGSGIASNWMDVAGSAATNAATVSIEAGTSGVFYRLRYTTP